MFERAEKALFADIKKGMLAAERYFGTSHYSDEKISNAQKERDTIRKALNESIERVKHRYEQRSEPFYFNDQVLDFSSSLIEGICFGDGSNSNKSPDYYDSVIQPIIKLIYDVYHPQRDISADDVRTFQTIFVQTHPYFQGNKQHFEETQAIILKSVPGRTREERLKNLRGDGPEELREFQEDWRDLNELRQIVQKSMDEYRQVQDTAFYNLLFGTDFIVRCMRKECVPILRILGDFFERHPVLFRSFIRSKNEKWVDPNSQDQDANIYGYSYVLYHPAFAAVIREKLSPKEWFSHRDSLPLFALVGNAVHAHTPASGMAELVKKVEQLPPDQIKIATECLFDMFTEFEKYDDLIQPGSKSLTAADKAYLFQINNLIPLIAQARSPIIIEQATRFFERMPVSFCQGLVDTTTADGDYKTFFSFLMKTPKGRKNLMQLSVANKQNLVWHLYAQKMVTADEMKKIVTEAVEQKNNDFLLMPKKINLTRDFPGYAVVRDYFHQAKQALAFIGSFQDRLMTPDVRFDLSQDFISDPEQRWLVARLYKIVPMWARSGQTQKIFSLMFQGNPEQAQTIRPLMTAPQMMALMTDQDETGKTAWHYLCQKKSRLFFGRLFKMLHPSFLNVMKQKDLDGQTPMDYVGADLKFKQMIIDKIPAAEKIMNEMGISAVYTPRIKEDAPKKPIVVEKSVAVEPKESRPVLRWKVEMIGNDKNREDSEYLDLIQARVEQLPPPQSGSVSVGNERLRKKTTLQAATLKINYNHTYWRIPYVHDSKRCIIYVLPGSDRSETYTNQDYCRLIRNWVKWLNRQRERT